MIFALNPDNKKEVKEISRLHSQLLPSSPVSKLGQFFMENFYYTDLVRARLIQADLYSLDLCFIGFSVYTTKPFTFMAEGKKKFFWKIVFVLAVSILQKPSRIKVILEMTKISATREQIKDTTTAEYMSLGVMFPMVDDIRVSDVLYDVAYRQLKGMGCKKMRMVIEKTNFIAQRFHRRLGAHNDFENGLADKYILMTRDIG